MITTDYTLSRSSHTDPVDGRCATALDVLDRLLPTEPLDLPDSASQRAALVCALP
jgi:hypothetical protein